MNRTPRTVLVHLTDMTTSPVLLCIRRDPERLRVLQENGYELDPVATGHEGLGVLSTRPADAIVLEYNPGLLNGSAIAPTSSKFGPICLLSSWLSPMEVPAAVLNVVDALVARSASPHFPLGNRPLHVQCEVGWQCQEGSRLESKKKSGRTVSSTA